MRAIANPVAPKALVQLDEWTAVTTAELELNDCLIEDKDFSHVQRLDAESCKMIAVQFAGVRFEKFRMSDIALGRVEAAGMRAPEAALLRIEARNSRMTGADFGASSFEDCWFENVKFDEAGFRFVTFKRVVFESCVLRNADFGGAKFAHVTFGGCDMEGANFNGASCTSVDLRGQDLSNLKGVLGLKGATISSEQLIQLAPLLATEAGLDIDYET